MTAEDHAIVRRVDDLFASWRKAMTRVSQTRRPDKLEAAWAEEAAAEKAYREASDERDNYFEMRRAQEMQRRG